MCDDLAVESSEELFAGISRSVNKSMVVSLCNDYLKFIGKYVSVQSDLLFSSSLSTTYLIIINPRVSCN